MATTSTAREASSRDLRVRVVACALVDSGVRLSFVVKNPYANPLGLVVPAAPKSAEAPEFPEFQGAWEAAAPTAGGEAIETRCGPDPRTRLTLEPSQNVTRSLVFPVARWASRAETQTIVKWRWRQFEVEHQWQEVAVSGCSLVQLAVENGSCRLIGSRPLTCPPTDATDATDAIDADLGRSDAEPAGD